MLGYDIGGIGISVSELFTELRETVFHDPEIRRAYGSFLRRPGESRRYRRSSSRHCYRRAQNFTKSLPLNREMSPRGDRQQCFPA
jgi:hypothetical protein